METPFARGTRTGGEQAAVTVTRDRVGAVLSRHADGQSKAGWTRSGTYRLSNQRTRPRTESCPY